MLEALIALIRLPYEALKAMQENSTTGTSPADRKSLRFWKGFAWILTTLVALGILAIAIILRS